MRTDDAINDSFFAVYHTSQGLEFVLYCNRNRWIFPKTTTILNFGIVFRQWSPWGKA